MKSVVFASLVATAAAFAPAQHASSSTSLKMAFESELGAQEPLGFFDPLGLVADGDQAKFDRLRYVEIKHGRISMLAVAGYLVQVGGVSSQCLVSSDIPCPTGSRNPSPR